jgi:hypothetical protein
MVTTELKIRCINAELSEKGAGQTIGIFSEKQVTNTKTEPWSEIQG